jgi:shikimate kinase
MLSASAIAYGAATIVNAIATGKGAALGVDLWTKARVELTDKPGIVEGRILSDPGEGTNLIKRTIRRVLRRFRLEGELGAYVETTSSIPIARGMKSSSAAANAISLATVAALKKKLSDLDVVKLGVEASKDAGVTITGAFDDACASYFGNIVVTDNVAQRVKRRFRVHRDYAVLFHVPSSKTYTAQSNVKKMKMMTPLVDVAYREALLGRYWSAMTFNGLIYSMALGHDINVAIDALAAGAIAAGISGKGPAVAAVVRQDSIGEVKQAWNAYEGEVIQARVNREKAHVVRADDG